MTATSTPGARFGANPLWREAQAALAQRQPQAANAVLTRLRATGPDADVYSELLAAQIAWAEDRVRDTCVHALEAARIAPDDPETLCAITNILLESGETTAARDCLDRLSLAKCQDPLLLMQAAMLHKLLEQHVESLAFLDHAKAIGDPNPALRYVRGRALTFVGRLNEAEEELAASLAAAPDRGTIAVSLVALRAQTSDRNWLQTLDSGARSTNIDPENQAGFEFARYKTLEDLGRYDEAWQALARGNVLMRERLQRRETMQMRGWLDRFLGVPICRPPGAVAKTQGPRPIFIVGMPRSGTTLLERMLGNHTQATPAGELLDFRQQLRWAANTHNIFTNSFLEKLRRLDCTELGRRYLAQTQWRAGGKPFYIDKQPPNWRMAGLIHAAIPDAPILNLVRDPVDTCFSNWRAFFGNTCAYSYDLTEMAKYYNSYRRTVEHWHRVIPGAILDVEYAALVQDPERTLRRVFDFCGMEWEAGCADLTRNLAPSATLSASQVRGKLQQHNSGRWRHYAQHLQPLLRALNAEGASADA